MIVYGSFTGNSGYSVHSRKLTEALMNLTDVKIINAGYLPDNAFDLIGYKLEKCLKNNNKHDDLLSISMPPHSLYFSGDRKNLIQYCVFEGDKIPMYWADILNKDFIKKVIVPNPLTITGLPQAIASNTGKLKASAFEELTKQSIEL